MLNIYGIAIIVRILAIALVLSSHCAVSDAQQGNGPTDWQRALLTPALSGYEQGLTEEIRNRLREFSPQTDSLGNVYVTIGAGAPHRLIATSIDEPGYVVSEITEKGYLRVQVVPQRHPNTVFDQLNFAQPVMVQIRNGQQITGVFAGLSLELQSGHVNPQQMTGLDEMYVDIGASSAGEVAKAGINLLDPLILSRQWFSVGKGGEAGPAVGDRFGAYVLAQVLEDMGHSKAKGTTTLAFLTQQWVGGRGMSRILDEITPDELIYVGRIEHEFVPRVNLKEALPGSGILIGGSSVSLKMEQPLAKVRKLAQRQRIPFHIVTSNNPLVVGDETRVPIPKRWIKLGVPILWPTSPGEFVAFSDIAQLRRLLAAYLEISQTPEELEKKSELHRQYRHSEALIGVYGVSGDEEDVRDAILEKLDARLREVVHQDSAGNLVLHLGTSNQDENTTKIIFIAHMDEIGFKVKKIEEDGRLQVKSIGDAYPQYFLGHPVLIHKKEERPVGGVLELPTGWDKPGFKWPNSLQAMNPTVHVYVGTKSKAETERLGITIGDSVTIPKEYRRLLGTRATAKSFDDRVGCSALITAANALGPDFKGRDVVFIWSAQDEVGMKGATAFAKQVVKENRVPQFVFPVEAFVSSASPLESKRFADAKLGKGFTVGAIDDSNITSRPYVDRVVNLAQENSIPVQYGVTRGRNDGSVFLKYGSIDIPLGWPLLYSQSPSEVIDTMDFNALAKIVEIIARKW